MTTRTAPRNSSKAQSRTEKDQPNWSSRNAKMQALGLSSMDELRHYERYERGTNGQRHQPRKTEVKRDHAVHVGNDKQSFLEPLWDYIDRQVGSEYKFPKDGNVDVLMKRGKQAGHVYTENDALTVALAGREYPVTVESCFEASARLRYRIAFENGAEMALTQAILLAIRVVKPLVTTVRVDPVPLVTTAPTHLLTAVCSSPVSAKPERFCYRDLTVEGEAAARVMEHIARHWERQIGKLFMPFGMEIDRVLYV